MRPIVTSDEMVEIEKKFIAQGGNVELLMDEVARSTSKLILESDPLSCLIIAGTGNNGADALLTGYYLLKSNVACTVWLLGPSKPSSLHHKQLTKFIEEGGKCVEDLPYNLAEFSCCIDGLFGIGFNGEPSERSLTAINWVNKCKRISPNVVVYSIDIPSGIDSTLGEVSKEAILADITVACHLPKWGLFLNKAWGYVGNLVIAPLSLPIPKSTSFIIEESDITSRMPQINRLRDKYSAGSVAGIAGSMEMPGASLLAAEASLRIGAGIVRLFTPQNAFYAQALREIIRIPTDIGGCSGWLETISQADAAFIGPGIGRSTEAEEIIKRFFPLLPEKRVIDGDGLYWSKILSLSLKNALITPHLREMGHLLGLKLMAITYDLIKMTESFGQEQGCSIILKGPPSFIFADGCCYVVTKGDPGMATAGSGDILTGIVTGLLSQKLSLLNAALVGCWLHGRAGEFASKALTPYCMIASDLIQTLPEAIFEQIGH